MRFIILKGEKKNYQNQEPRSNSISWYLENKLKGIKLMLPTKNNFVLNAWFDSNFKKNQTEIKGPSTS